MTHHSHLNHNNVVLKTDLPLGINGQSGPIQRGKVRDIYDLGDCLLFVATDRISAFDVVLPNGIPGKGFVLTQLSLFWFKWLDCENLTPHHLITGDFDAFPKHLHPYREILEGRSLLVRKVKPLPVEAIVRGYLSGSGWKEYSKKGTICEQKLPEGLLESSQLMEPIFTPSTKGEIGEHDINISFDEMKKRVGELSDEMRERSLTIYKKAATYAATRGIIIADTKMEFGTDPNTKQLVLIDELLTPDSSRFWPEKDYQPGRSQISFDKQYVRDYLLSLNWRGDTVPPFLPESVIEQTSKKYLEALERLTS
jgi:phosphoribosylaminoimidazole-succinocarboxamide synthase